MTTWYSPEPNCGRPFYHNLIKYNQLAISTVISESLSHEILFLQLRYKYFMHISVSLYLLFSVSFKGTRNTGTSESGVSNSINTTSSIHILQIKLWVRFRWERKQNTTQKKTRTTQYTHHHCTELKKILPIKLLSSE